MFFYVCIITVSYFLLLILFYVKNLLILNLFLSFFFSVKYVGFFSCCLGMTLVWWDYWHLLSNKLFSDFSLFCNAVARFLVMALVGITVYLSVFYIHLAVLNKAGPHDSIMTSAFQASLEVINIYYININF